MRKSRRVNHALKVAREALASKRASANAEEEESKHEGAINYMDQSDHDIELTSLDLRQVPDDSIEPPVRFRSAAPMKQQIPAKKPCRRRYCFGPWIYSNEKGIRIC